MCALFVSTYFFLYRHSVAVVADAIWFTTMLLSEIRSVRVDELALICARRLPV